MATDASPPPPQCMMKGTGGGPGPDGGLGSCQASGIYNNQPRDVSCNGGNCTCMGPNYNTPFVIGTTCPTDADFAQYCCH
jgi:hypothetical protein